LSINWSGGIVGVCLMWYHYIQGKNSLFNAELHTKLISCKNNFKKCPTIMIGEAEVLLNSWSIHMKAQKIDKPILLMIPRATWLRYKILEEVKVHDSIYILSEIQAIMGNHAVLFFFKRIEIHQVLRWGFSAERLHCKNAMHLRQNGSCIIGDDNDHTDGTAVLKI